MTAICRVCLLAVAFSLAFPSHGSAQDKTEDGSSLKKWIPFYDSQAEAYAFSRAEDPDVKLELRMPALLTYTNPVRRTDQHGSIYLWTLDNRPFVIGSVWSSNARDSPGMRNVCHEFQSLSSDPLASFHEERVGRKGVVPQWLPPPGVEFKRLEKAPSPGGSPPRRLVQMRQLARQFSASILQPREEARRDLRLLSQPLYRYESKSVDVIDGGVFALVIGTDPEAFLMIEAVQEGDASYWQYALARFTNSEIDVKLADRSVWKVNGAVPYVGDQSYFLYWGIDQVAAER